MESIENKCFFTGDNNSCRILDVENCDGANTNCKFFKTEKKFNDDRNKAIDMCRERELCTRCKYKAKPCMKSDEV
ncbi:MAG: hypothetical protein NC320_00960 [Clostridium sp.]|nr:hypothetical protein [Clostridium sp.]